MNRFEGFIGFPTSIFKEGSPYRLDEFGLKYLRRFEEFGKKGVGVAYLGGASTGKTTQLAMLFSEILNKNAMTALWVPADRLPILDDAPNRRPVPFSDEQTWGERLRSVELLAVDGVSDQEEFWRILAVREPMRLTTLFSANWWFYNELSELDERRQAILTANFIPTILTTDYREERSKKIAALWGAE